MRGRGAAGLAESNAHAQQQQLREAGRNAAQRGQARPQRHDEENDVHAVEPLRKARDGNSAERVQQRKCRTYQQSELRIGELEIGLQRLTDNRDQGPISRVQRIRQHQ